MNTLGYAILGVLERKPCSGYQLANYLDVLWPAKHSQIYPLLTKMEQNNFLVYKHVEQTGKPNKKIYSITEKGKKELQKWVKKIPADSIIRDEFLVKVYSIWSADEESAKELIENRISALEQKVTQRAKKIAKIEEGQKNDLNIQSKHFGRYILFNRRNLLDKEEITWCNWVLNMIKTANGNKILLSIFGISQFNNIVQNMIIIN